jgi:hypothetical protein
MKNGIFAAWQFRIKVERETLDWVRDKPSTSESI